MSCAPKILIILTKLTLQGFKIWAVANKGYILDAL